MGLPVVFLTFLTVFDNFFTCEKVLQQFVVPLSCHSFQIQKYRNNLVIDTQKGNPDSNNNNNKKLKWKRQKGAEIFLFVIYTILSRCRRTRQILFYPIIHHQNKFKLFDREGYVYWKRYKFFIAFHRLFAKWKELLYWYHHFWKVKWTNSKRWLIFIITRK